VSAFGALVAGLEPTFVQGSDASRAVDTPPSICTSLGGWEGKLGPRKGCLPPVCVCACDVGSPAGRVGRPLLRGQTPDPACGAHGPDPRCWQCEKVGQGRGRPPKADRCRRAHTTTANPHHGPPRGQGGKFERGGGRLGWHSQSGFDYFRQANGLCWLFRLMANRLRSKTNILVCLTLAQENAYT